MLEKKSDISKQANILDRMCWKIDVCNSVLYERGMKERNKMCSVFVNTSSYYANYYFNGMESA